MAPSSFHATLFDYLRIVFHRIMWILVIFALTITVGWIWGEWVMPKQYPAKMTVMVWSRDMDNPLVRRMVQPAPLREIINTIRSKLQVDRRLRLMACNLRFAVKEDHWSKVQYPQLVQEAEQAEVPLDPLSLLQEELQGQWPRVHRVAPEKVVLQKIVEVQKELPILGSHPLMQVTSAEYDLRDVVAQADTQTLARVLVPALQDEVLAEADGFADEYVIRDVEDPADRYVGSLRRLFFPERPNAPYAMVRAEAVKEVTLRLEREMQVRGSGKFTPPAAWELLKEIRTIGHLMDLSLSATAAELAAGGSLQFWVSNLKNGLNVGAVRGNIMEISYTQMLFRRQQPYVREDNKNVIPHLVVRVAYAMTEAEFRTAERDLWEDALSLLESRKKTLVEDLERLNRELNNYEEIRNLQLSLNQSLADPGNTEGVPGEYWTDPFSGLLRPTVHIDRINREIDEIAQIDKQIAELEAQAGELRKQIENPDHRYIEVRRQPDRQELPEVVRLRGQLVMKQLEMRKLLQRNTTQHPMVRNLQVEINEIQAALQRALPQVHGDSEIERSENPELRQWRRSLEATERDLKGLKGRREQSLSIIEDEKRKAKEAIEKQRAFEDARMKQSDVREKLDKVLSEEEVLMAKRDMASQFDVQFEEHTAPGRPGSASQPKVALILLMASLIGLIAAGTTVFVLEYTDHSIKTIEEARRHFGLPVMGTIPEYSFERFEKVWPRGLRSFGSRRRENYPKPLDVEAPKPLREREALRMVNRPVRLLIYIAAGLLVVAGGAYAAWVMLGRGDDGASASGGTPTRVETPGETGSPDSGSVGGGEAGTTETVGSESE